MNAENRTPCLPLLDARQGDCRAAIDRLRERLSPRGNVVSEAGRQRTIAVFGEPLTPQQVVEQIVGQVRDRGLEAVLEYTAKLDGATLTAAELRVSPDALAEAHSRASDELLAVVRRVRDNIWRFQRALLPGEVRLELDRGGYLVQRSLPLQRVGICVPGGAASYPSTVLMTAVPAQAAGVRELAIVAPPTRFGSYNTELLATCHELGITEVYRMGGAQAVAALAYGIEGVPQVDKIVGPGNLFVALAKKLVYGEVDIDSIAGPSEVVVVGDDSTDARFTAADLIAQAEHAPGASILITWSERLAAAVETALEEQLATLARGDLARACLSEFGALILVRSAEAACQLANEIAPEHLHIATQNAEEFLPQIPNAGATFLGPYTPVALGDYAAGPSHVLPTGGTARFASGLASTSFLRTSSVLHFGPETLTEIAPLVQTLADVEGLTAHRASVDVRLAALKGQTD